MPKGFESPDTTMTADVRPQFRAQLPAITHVNGSARVQTVGEDNLEFHTLLKAVGKRTGREMVLNTSFNVKGQPISNTPREAIDTFSWARESNFSSSRIRCYAAANPNRRVAKTARQLRRRNLNRAYGVRNRHASYNFTVPPVFAAS